MRKKYFIITYGCQMNRNDSERWAFLLEKRGYLPAKKISEADLVLINMCSVREEPVRRVYQRVEFLNNLKKKKPSLKIWLTGCILPEDREKFKERVDKILPIVDFSLPAKRENKETAFVSIMTGCNNFCSYCVVPYTRGREISKPFNKVMREIKKLLKEGCRKIILLGQNVNAYQAEIKEKGRTKKINFAELLRRINKIPGNFKIGFLTNNPKYMTDELIETIASLPKVEKKIHLAVQSGNNEILKKMRRKYTIEEFKEIIRKIKKKIPQAILTTDIIVGFPGETKKQFEDTLKLVKEIKFNNVYISRYSPRPGTLAYRLEDNVSPEEKKRRKEKIEEVLRSCIR